MLPLYIEGFYKKYPFVCKAIKKCKRMKTLILKIRVKIITVLLLLHAFSVHAQIDTKGTDFWLTFGCIVNATYSQVNLQIRIVGGDQAATGVIYFTQLNTTQTFSIAAGQVYTYNLTNAEQQAVYNTTAGTSNRSVHITSSAPITAYALNQMFRSADATNILPVTALGTDYYQISYSTVSGYPDAYAVVATQNTTRVYHNSTLSATINAGQVYYRTSSNADMTGNHITTDKPVAFFAVNQGTQIPTGTSYVDNLFQQLAPVNTWGKTFFVPVSWRGKDFVRIVASQNGTNITQIGGTRRTVSGGQNTLTNLNAGQWVELEVSLANNGCYIQADKPVGVCAYLTSTRYNPPIDTVSDPAQAWLPAIEQKINSSLIAPFIPAGTTNLNAHFALIITSTAAKDSTTVSIGGATATSLSGGTWCDNAAAGMSFYSMPLTNSTSAYLFTNLTDGIIVMGYGTGVAESYYYLSSSGMRSLDIAFYVNDIHYQDLASEIICTQAVQFRAAINGGMSTKPGHLKWYVNNVEDTTIRDSIVWSKNFPNGIYQIKMIALAYDGTADTIESSITINQVSVPEVTTPLLTYWQYDFAPSLLLATGASADPGHTLKWYLHDETTEYTGANDSINTTVAGISNYYVSQINDTTGCESDRVLVSVVITKPQVLQYIACPGANVNIGVEVQNRVSIFWYAAQTGGDALNSSPSITYTVTNVSPPQTFWIEPRVGERVYERIPITINLSESCGGTPVDCAVKGTVLFKEDFGGNNPSDPAVKPTGIPQVSSIYQYIASATFTGEGQYSINKYSFPHSSGKWYRVDDHTYPLDATRGYMLNVNAAAEKGQFYEIQIDELCSQAKLYFTVWLVSLVNHSGGVHKTNQIFTLEDNIGTIIVQYYTGNIPDMDSTWKQYGFEFTVPNGITSLKLRILNNGEGANGNDFCLDDIEIHLCTPPVTITVPSTSDTALCEGSFITLKGTYTDDGTFGDSLTYRWERSLTGDVANPAAWTSLITSTDTSPLNATHPITSMNAADTGYYRLLVGTSTSIDQLNCRAASVPIRLKMNPTPVLTPPTDQTFCMGDSTEDVIFTGTNVDADSSVWINNNTDIGLEANGIGNIVSFTASNTTHSPIIAKITVTPKSIQNGNVCVGEDTSFFITVLPLDSTILYDTVCQNHAYIKHGFDISASELQESGTFEFQDTIPNAMGCDSIILLKLSVIPLDTTVLYDTICQNNAYLKHGFDISTSELQAAGTFEFQDTISNAMGCDSIIILKLSVIPFDTTVLYDTTDLNNAYTKHGFDISASELQTIGIFEFQNTVSNSRECDSVIILKLNVKPSDTTVLYDTICQNNAYTKYGFDISASELQAAGTFEFWDTILNSMEYDSLIVLKLTVKPIPSVVIPENLFLCVGEISSPISFSGTNIDEIIWEITYGLGTEIGMEANNGTETIPPFTAINNSAAAVSVEITLTPKSANGCTGKSETFTITVYGQTHLEVNLGNDTIICWFDSLQLNAYHPEATHYQWQDGSTNAVYPVYYDGQYWVTISNPCGKASDTIQVSLLKEIILNLGNDTVFCEDDNIYWELDVASPYASYLWQDGSASPVYIVRDEGVYSVTVSNICMSATDEVAIKVKNCDSLAIWVPNAFTPNGDGLNDIFKPIIYKSEELKEYEMVIYDRWGNLIFITRDYQKGWDGNDASGHSYAEGIYSCMISLTEISGKKIIRKTSVTLTR